MSGTRIARPSRRDLFTRGIAAATAGALAGEAATAPAADALSPTPGELIGGLLAWELLMVFAYEHILGLGLLSPANARLARQILGYERAHARRLSAELSIVGATAPPPPANVRDADRALADRHASASLVQLHTETDVLRLLYDIESIGAGRYYLAIGKLTDPRLLRAAAETMAAEAQHAAVLGAILHPGDYEKIVPVSLVVGKH